MNKFQDFGLLPSLISTLTQQKITRPTEIQHNTISILMGGKSVVGVSETGSGKTLAYALPLLNALKTLETDGHAITAEATPRAIVMVPSRELGEQVSKVFKTLTHDTRVRVRPALGGMAMEQARRNVSGCFEILLATPGRLVQLMDREEIDLSDVRLLVFDEADQMMDQGFLNDSNKIYYACPKEVQLALFSATISPAVQDLINDLFDDAELIKSSGSGKVVKTLTTRNMTIKDGDRWATLEKILAKPIDGGTILFTNTREQCDKLAQELKDRNFEASVYRGEMENTERRANLKRFTDGKVKFLVATDLAGRGLDISNVDRVINFHLPKQLDNYIHRAGRTARAGRTGVVINLVTEKDEFLIAKLEGRKIKQIDSSKYNSYATKPVAEKKKGPAAKKAAPLKAEPKDAPKGLGKGLDKSSGKPLKAEPKDAPKGLGKGLDKSSGKPSSKAAGKTSASAAAKPNVKPNAKTNVKTNTKAKPKRKIGFQKK